MDAVVILLSISGVLLIYQIFFHQDEDALDSYGHPLKRKQITDHLFSRHRKSECDEFGLPRKKQQLTYPTGHGNDGLLRSGIGRKKNQGQF